MSQCPKCGAFLEEESGMATCSACGAFVFLEYGQEQKQASNTESENSPKAKPENEPGSEIEYELKVKSGESPHRAQTPASASESHSSEAPFSSDAFTENYGEQADPLQNLFFPDSAESAAGQVPQQGPDFQPGGGLDTELSAERNSEPEEAPLEPEVQAEYNPGIAMMGEDFGPADDPLGLNEYANSEVSQAKDGLLHFRILISGIDTKEIRQSLREAMEDSRFNWDAASILAGVRFGELKLDHVTPVKATVLISRIKRLPIRIRWEQYAITQSDGTD